MARFITLPQEVGFEGRTALQSKLWRLIPPWEGSGTAQMAIDSWLLAQHGQGLMPSTLRFYTWQKPTLSLGYHQHEWPSHWQNLRWQDQAIEWVRRPTGGRAVLHQGDLTYAVVTSGLKGSRRAIYQQICQFLIEGWRQLDVELLPGKAQRGYLKNPSCFSTATAADLVMACGYKLVGSAQVYRQGCVLQHGSIRLNPDPALFTAVFGEPLKVPADLARWHSSEGMALLRQALIRAATQSWGVSFRLTPLSDQEVSKAVKHHFQQAPAAR